MGRLTVTVKRVGGAPDLASRVKVFGSDANAEPLICSACRFGEEEDWTPMMKRSQCPACGNRENHTPKRKKRKFDNPA